MDTAGGMGRLLISSATTCGPPTTDPGPRGGPGIRPEYVLLDIGLPGMDGYEVARRLRKDEWCKDVVIVAISGYGQEEDRRRSNRRASTIIS